MQGNFGSFGIISSIIFLRFPAASSLFRANLLRHLAKTHVCESDVIVYEKDAGIFIIVRHFRTEVLSLFE